MGRGIFSESLGIVKYLRLLEHCSIFQVEISALQAAVDTLQGIDLSSADMAIFSDSQADIRALDSEMLNSRSVYRSRTRLNEFAVTHRVRIIWIPG